MTEEQLEQLLEEAKQKIRDLEKELGETNRGLMALTMELEQRVDQRTEQLRDSEAKYRAVFQSLVEGVVFLNPEGEVVEANAAVERLHGHTFEQLSSAELDPRFRIIRPDGSPFPVEEQPAIVALRTGYAVRDVEMGVPGSDGKIRWRLVNAQPVHDDQRQLLGVVASFFDITERRQAEEAIRQVNELLELRVAERTAELRERTSQLQRLTSELTLAEQRERRRLAQVLHDHLQQLLVGAKFGLGIVSRRADKGLKESVQQVEGLIDESIKASRSLTAELSPPILHEAGLAAALEWLARWMRDKYGLDVSVHTDSLATTDREDVRVLVFESVRELLFNVVKHAHVTSAKVELAAYDPEHIAVTVEDHGQGFDREKLFSGSGTVGGFGLFSIRERLSLLSGRLEITSAIGQGSRFTIIAPARLGGPVPRHDQASVPDVSAQPPLARTFRRRSTKRGAIRLLLADDHAMLRQGLSSILAEDGDIEVVGEAGDGVEAVDEALRLRPDVVLIDFSMPKMGGVEATRRIRQQMPAVCIIGLSMYGELDRSAAMMDAGADAYLTKSGDVDELLGTIRRLIASKAGHQANP